MDVGINIFDYLSNCLQKALPPAENGFFRRFINLAQDSSSHLKQLIKKLPFLDCNESEPSSLFFLELVLRLRSIPGKSRSFF
jgi:hypothetical protein